MSHMKRNAMPAPEDFGRPESTKTITFRIGKSNHAKLVDLARRAKLGHSALARRIVEHYIEQHAATRGRKG